VAELFLDTSYAIALSSPPDQYHARASALADEIEAQQRRFVTTRAVMLEIGNAQRVLLATLDAAASVETLGDRGGVAQEPDDAEVREFLVLGTRPSYRLSADG
jgi:predicted nucleic acid-binding protein